MRRFIGTALVGLSACALIADLPDYVEKDGTIPGEGGSGGIDGSIEERLDASVNNVLDGALPDAGPDATKPDAALLSCGDAGESNGLVAHWTLDEGSGTTANDCTRRALDGTLQNGPTWVAGHIGGALGFNGSSYVDFGDPSAMGITGAMSVSAWVWIDSFEGSGRILAKGGSINDRGWNLNVEGNGTAAFYVAVTDELTADARTDAAVPTKTWLHFVGVYQPSVAVRLYMNGQQVALQTTGVPANQRNAAALPRMGMRSDCCGLVGRIDDVRLYDRVLSVDDVDVLLKQ